MDRPRLMEQPLMRRLVAPAMLAAGLLVAGACGHAETETSMPVYQGTIPEVEGTMPGTTMPEAISTEVPTSKWEPATTTTTRKTYTTRTETTVPSTPVTINSETCADSSAAGYNQQCLVDKIGELTKVYPPQEPDGGANLKLAVLDPQRLSAVDRHWDNISDPASQARAGNMIAEHAAKLFEQYVFYDGKGFKALLKDSALIDQVERAEAQTAAWLSKTYFAPQNPMPSEEMCAIWWRDIQDKQIVKYHAQSSPSVAACLQRNNIKID